ncbi:MAG: hypothetical protein P4L85_11855 [Paludisphaera borealis]|uniref:hypothetical protein n=1 Tax=Paludisphaera borealis TaxID=1387353 RepID=UPI0028495110|nr:hypothetical protein [Paludisphaera borealis]MDR3620036.1 hypothetical protein [Paludisphaera borealis]
MTRQSKKQQPLFRRLVYFVVMVMTGGSAGIGGWFFKDYPQLQALTEAVLGKSVDEIGQGEGSVIKERLASAVSQVLTRDPKRPGVYKVRITELKLDPKQFTAGKTVDIQAEVRKIDAEGKSVLVWESKSFGENLAVVGRDDLSVDWNKRPFEIEWRSGDQIVVAAWDRKAGFFSPKTFKMALPEPDTFPLASGPHVLAVVSSRSADQSTLNRIVFDSQRTGDAADRPTVARKGSDRPAVDVAERPIIIK